MTTGQEARTPPRYVPTLTDVVTMADGVLPRPEAVLLSDVPLTQETVLHETPVLPEPLAEAVPGAPIGAPDVRGDWTEQVAQRVLERLEQRLSTLLEEQSADMARGLAQAVAHRLRAELPELVQQAVHTFPAPFEARPDSGS